MSVAESTGYSPAFITQGRETKLPNALFDEHTTGTGRCTQTTAENAEKLKEIFELVRRNMKKAAQDQARHYNLRRRLWKPKVGDTVWAKEHHLSKAGEGFVSWRQGVADSTGLEGGTEGGVAEEARRQTVRGRKDRWAKLFLHDGATASRYGGEGREGEGRRRS
uniref:GG11945 n=1 Tax=Drosophila erecta TaxID=7220 RepID=B3P245_DROER